MSVFKALLDEHLLSAATSIPEGYDERILRDAPQTDRHIPCSPIQ